MNREKKSLYYYRLGVILFCLSYFIFIFTGIFYFEPLLFQFQFGPSFLKLFYYFSLGTISTFAIIALMTWIFGRFYCSVLCPMGIFQDIIIKLSPFKSRNIKSIKILHYFLLFFILGLFVGGMNLGFWAFDPYSITGRLLSTFSIGAMIPWLIIGFLSIWYGRIFCKMVCPIGAMLGFFAKYNFLHLQISSDSCIHCQQCVKHCPMDCIDLKTQEINAESCVRCLNCIITCPNQSIHWRFFGGKENRNKIENEPDLKRREFIKIGSIFAVGMTMGWGFSLLELQKLKEFSEKFHILPPGADSAKKFIPRCTGCQLCTKVCPEKIIVASMNGLGPVFIESNKGFCRYECNRCSEICPTGAIRPLSLSQKKTLKIADVNYHSFHCKVVLEDTECGLCANACPTHAATLNSEGYPVFNQNICIGCGICQSVCPVTPKAISMTPIPRQKILISQKHIQICQSVCPVTPKAISMTPIPRQKILISQKHIQN